METRVKITKPTVRSNFECNCYSFIHIGKERNEVGRIKSVVANPCRSSKESFTKFITIANGDPYVDPGKFNNQLRGQTP